MNYLKFIISCLFVATSILSVTSCQSGDKSNEQGQEIASSSESGPDISAVLDQYFNLKDALVETNAPSGKANAQNLLSAIETSSSGLNDSELVNQLNSLKTAVQPIASSENIEEQRAAFEKATASMLTIIKKHKLTDKTLYYQFCPMAFNGKGAYWISNEKKIMNPYFGDRMLHCGKVTEEL